MAQKLRTFVAANISDNARQRIADFLLPLEQLPAKVKWVEPENLHLTLKFLGEVHGRDIPKIIERVAAATKNLAPFDFDLTGMGAFPDASRPRTVWIGIDQGGNSMVALHDAIEEQLAELGYRTERRRFRPHLTIGRVRQSPSGLEQLAEVIAENSGTPFGRNSLKDVVIYSSRLQSSGPTYVPLGRAPLIGKA